VYTSRAISSQFKFFVRFCHVPCFDLAIQSRKNGQVESRERCGACKKWPSKAGRGRQKCGNPSVFSPFLCICGPFLCAFFFKSGQKSIPAKARGNRAFLARFFSNRVEDRSWQERALAPFFCGKNPDRHGDRLGLARASP
jgi:hypothetical protein